MTRTNRTARRLAVPIVVLAVMTLLLPLPVVGAKVGKPQVTSIASGLRNPRGLDWHAGALYVAEAGKGGSGPCAEGPEGEACFGRSGAITRLRGGNQVRVSGGLPSTAAPDGSAATGPHDVAVDHGKLYVTVGVGGKSRVQRRIRPPGEGTGAPNAHRAAGGP